MPKHTKLYLRTTCFLIIFRHEKDLRYVKIEKIARRISILAKKKDSFACWSLFSEVVSFGCTHNPLFVFFILFYLFCFFWERGFSHNVSWNVFLMLILEGVLFIWPTTSSSFRCKGSLCEICLNKGFFLIFLLITSFWESTVWVLSSVGFLISLFVC